MIIEILGSILKTFKHLKKAFFKNLLLSISVISLVIIFSFIFHIYRFNSFNINNSIPRIFIILCIFILFYIFSFSIIGLDKSQYSDYAFSKSFKFIFIFMIYLGLFFVFLLFLNIGSKVILYSDIKSSIFTLLFVILLLAFLHEFVIKNLKLTNDNYSLSKILMDLVFYIPCLLVDFIEFITKDIKNTPKTTWILLYLIIFYCAIVYIIPFINNYLKDKNEIILLKETVELNKKVVFVKQDELKEKIIDSKPFLQRKILQASSELDNQMEKYKSFNDSNRALSEKYNTYQNKKIFMDDPRVGSYINDIPKCKTSNVLCKDKKINNNDHKILYCSDKSTGQNYEILNYHNMYESCDSNALSDLFKTPEELTYIYKDSNKDKKVSLIQYCKDKYETSNVSCITPDLSKNIANYNDYSDNMIDPSYVYSCNNLDISINTDEQRDKYNIITGYNDKSNEETVFNCKKEGFRTEGFRDNIHNFDVTVNKHNEISKLNEAEKKIIYDTLNEDEEASMIIKKLNDENSINTFITEYLNKNQGRNSIMRKLNEYNNNTNEFIHQELSEIVKYINRANQFYTYNYHYAISFWLYLDTAILKDHYENKIGFIMSYADTPKMYYDYETKELFITNNNCTYDDDYNKLNCNPEIIYKTSDLLFQKWNNFVINYNYGTLDIFINNNLVITKSNVSPYIDNNNFIQFGDTNEPMINCAICKVEYYDKPLKLNQIKDNYKNKNNPCN